jgi:integrase/recombinase XerD
MSDGTLLAMVHPFGQSLIANGRSQATASAYTSDVRKFVNWIEVNHLGTVENFDTLAAAYINAEREGEHNRNTVLRYMSSIRAFYNFLRSTGMELPEPFVAYKGPKPVRASSHPLPGLMVDVDAMVLAAYRPHHKVLIALCGYAGLRVSEARSICPRSLFMDGEANWWLAIHGKGGVYREVPVSDQLLRVLADYGHASGPDVPYVDIKDRAARQAIKGVARRAGITRDVSSHDLRHTFGTTVYSRTKDLRVTQDLMGHASSATTEGYTKVSQGAKLGAIQ